MRYAVTIKTPASAERGKYLRKWTEELHRYQDEEAGHDNCHAGLGTGAEIDGRKRKRAGNGVAGEDSREGIGHTLADKLLVAV